MMTPVQALKNTPMIDTTRTLNREAGRNTDMFFRIDMGQNLSNNFNLNEEDFIEVSPFEITSIELFGKTSSNVSVERVTRGFSLDLKVSRSGDFEYCILNLSVPSNSSFWLFAFFSSMRAVT